MFDRIRFLSAVASMFAVLIGSMPTQAATGVEASLDALRAGTPAVTPGASTNSKMSTLSGSNGLGSTADRLEAAKADLTQMKRDLQVLQEEMVFPSNMQVAVFVSMEPGTLFDLDAVQIRLDGELVSNYLYTPIERDGLRRGGSQRVFLGNLRPGRHEIVAYFVGRDYRRSTTIKFDKTADSKYIEVRIRNSQQKLQPEFSVKVLP